MADLLGSILSSMEKPPTVGDKESRRKAREQAARMKKMHEAEKKNKADFRKKMEKEVSDFIQDSTQPKRKYAPMGKIERSILHDVAEVAGLTSFSFGKDEESRYVMLFKKESAPTDDELEAYRKGEEWNPRVAEQRRRLKDAAHTLEANSTYGLPVANKRDKRSIEEAMNQIRAKKRQKLEEPVGPDAGGSSHS
ncbi:hypothetical protein CRUP_022279 [Coryphaenoides rupestris]|nr:hypothetical protein CRUP_022279 [Coryphaenoides rupestris]